MVNSVSVKPLYIETDSIGPNQDHVIFRLLPDHVIPSDGAGYIDPPSAAAFAIIRIDELTPGETEAEIGRRHRAVRIVVRNHSDEPAKFRMEIPVLPNPVKLGQELTKICDDAWRAAWDRIRRSN